MHVQSSFRRVGALLLDFSSESTSQFTLLVCSSSRSGLP